MTLFRILIDAAGLSLSQASVFLDARSDSVMSWSSGRRATPPGVIDDLHELVARQQAAADEAVSVIEKTLAAHGSPESINIGVCADDHEAQSLGWPTASSHAAVIGRMLAQLLEPDMIRRIRIVPRGSTAATDTRITRLTG